MVWFVCCLRADQFQNCFSVWTVLFSASHDSTKDPKQCHSISDTESVQLKQIFEINWISLCTIHSVLNKLTDDLYCTSSSHYKCTNHRPYNKNGWHLHLEKKAKILLSTSTGIFHWKPFKARHWAQVISWVSHIISIYAQQWNGKDSLDWCRPQQNSLLSVVRVDTHEVCHMLSLVSFFFVVSSRPSRWDSIKRAAFFRTAVDHSFILCFRN